MPMSLRRYRWPKQPPSLWLGDRSGRDGCAIALPATTRLSQHPSGDDPSLLKHLGHVRLQGGAPLRGLRSSCVDV